MLTSLSKMSLYLAALNPANRAMAEPQLPDPIMETRFLSLISLLVQLVKWWWWWWWWYLFSTGGSFQTDCGIKKRIVQFAYLSHLTPAATRYSHASWSVNKCSCQLLVLQGVSSWEIVATVFFRVSVTCFSKISLKVLY